MKYAIVSCSLNSNSRSRILAKAALNLLHERNEETDFVDLSEIELPFCDGDSCYGDPNVRELKERLLQADGFLIATPVYVYDVNAAAKNLVELMGRDVWTEKVVGFLCAAGGRSSYMSVMGIANSLALDFHTVVLPYFVYATGEEFAGDVIGNPEVETRLDRIVLELVRFTTALAK
jgi:FMN reductase